MLLDVNILVAAHQRGHTHHLIAADWLQRTLASPKDGQGVLLAMPVISGFFRLVTNPKIFAVPSTAAVAVDFVDWLLADPSVRLLNHAEEWPSLRKLMLEKDLKANQVPDAWLASLALSLSEPFVTFDKDFRQLLPRNLLVLLAA